MRPSPFNLPAKYASGLSGFHGRRVRYLACAAAGCALLAAVGAELAPPKPQPAGTLKMVERLAGLEAAAKPFANRFLTSKAIMALRARLAETPGVAEQLPLKGRLGE